MAEPVPCTTYSIVGTLNDERVATVRVHLVDEPLVGHRVFAVFAGDEMESTPAVLLTGPDGTATVALPEGADAVTFSAESPLGGACAGDGSPGTEPEIVVVSDTVGQPVPEPAPRVPPVVDESAGPGLLAVTGPVAPELVLLGALFVVAGWFGRRLRGTETPDPGAAPCRFGGFPL